MDETARRDVDDFLVLGHLTGLDGKKKWHNKNIHSLKNEMAQLSKAGL
jgi:hypothetical protein